MRLVIGEFDNDFMHDEKISYLDSTYLMLDDYDIKDLTPLSNFVNLIALNLNDNCIEDLTPISNLVNLIELRLDNNYIKDLTPLSKFINLEHLSLDITYINDLSPLSNLINLKRLLISGINDTISESDNSEINSEIKSDNSQIISEIDDLNFISKLVNLEKLTIVFTKVSDITPLNNLINIVDLDLRDNQINDITVLTNLKNLQQLFLANNKITDITPLNNLNNLIYLDMSNNKITKFKEDDLQLPNLEELHLYNTQINSDLKNPMYNTNLSFLNNFKNLKLLNLMGNIITDTTILNKFDNLANTEIHISAFPVIYVRNTDHPLVKSISFEEFDENLQKQLFDNLNLKENFKENNITYVLYYIID